MLGLVVMVEYFSSSSKSLDSLRVVLRPSYIWKSLQTSANELKGISLKRNEAIDYGTCRADEISLSLPWKDSLDQVGCSRLLSHACCCFRCCFFCQWFCSFCEQSSSNQLLLWTIPFNSKTADASAFVVRLSKLLDRHLLCVLIVNKWP